MLREPEERLQFLLKVEPNSNLRDLLGSKKCFFNFTASHCTGKALHRVSLGKNSITCCPNPRCISQATELVTNCYAE